MNTTIVSTIDHILHRLPRRGAHREVALQRLTDMYAAGESIGALRTEAERARHALVAGDPESEAIAEVLTAASELWNGSGVPVAEEDDFGVRDGLARAVSSPAFDTVVRRWIIELRRVANDRPGSGACAIATAMQLWQWTLTHFQRLPDSREVAIIDLAEAFCWLAAARAQILEAATPAGRVSLSHRAFLDDLCHVQAARAAGAVATTCAELVFGYRRHPSWDVDACVTCYRADDLDELEGLMPGIASSARAHSDVIEADGSHEPKAGPCAKRTGVETFVQLRTKLDGCLTGARLTKQRAAQALPKILSLTPSTH